MNNIISGPMHVTEPIVTRATEPDWSGWEKWLRSHLDIDREVMIEAFGEALGLVSQELRDRISALELKLAELTGAIDILRGTPPPPERDTRALSELLSTERQEFGNLLEQRTRGFELKLAELTGAVDILRGAQPPPPAQFPRVKAFNSDTIYHEGDIVAFAGGTWQAQRDTPRAPGAQDWMCLAVAGAGFTIRGTYDSNAEYRYLDVAMLNGSSFVALKDAPGPCPGDDWQLLASRGSRGDRGLKGERGLVGPRGDAGASGATIRDWKIERERYVATPVMSDGSDGPSLELRGLFEQFLAEVR
jgi:hypothetical protein